MPDERPWSVSASRRTDDARSDSQQVISARHAAEALFKPKQAAKIGHPMPTHDTPPSREQPSQRQPRILTKAEPEPRREPETPGTTPNKRQTRTERAGKIPASEHGRVRTLATYGMTLEQVAELYEIGLSEVERIIGKGEGRNDA